MCVCVCVAVICMCQLVMLFIGAFVGVRRPECLVTANRRGDMVIDCECSRKQLCASVSVVCVCVLNFGWFWFW